MTRERSPVRTLGSLLMSSTLLLSLAACGGIADPHASTPSSSLSGASATPNDTTYNATLPSGAVMRIILPAAPPPDPELESLRLDAGIKRALYTKITIDNSRGSKPVSVKRLVLTAEDGAVYRLDAVPRAVQDWVPQPAGQGQWHSANGDLLDAAQAESLNERVDSLTATYTGDVPVGGQGEEILVGDLDSIPESFASMELIPSMGDAEETPIQPSPGGGNGSGPVAPQPPAVPDGEDSPSEPAEESPHEGSPTSEPQPGSSADPGEGSQVTAAPGDPASPGNSAADEDDSEAVQAPDPVGSAGTTQDAEAVERSPADDSIGSQTRQEPGPAGTDVG